MIITVEGPSAAGKTTWIYSHFEKSVINYELEIENAPDKNSSPEESAHFWARVSKERWASVCTNEKETGLVVCDSDPFKLHYVWSLWRIGEVDEEQWRAQMIATRKLFANYELGLSDIFLVNIPDHTTLKSRAQTDPKRSRPNFNLHARLSEPLKEWYQAIERLDASRVCWEFPANGIDPLKAIGPREERSGVELFDKVIANLPVR